MTRSLQQGGSRGVVIIRHKIRTRLPCSWDRNILYFLFCTAEKTKMRWWMRKPAHSVLLFGEQRLDWGLGGGSECQFGCGADILLHSLYVLNRKQKKKKKIWWTNRPHPLQSKCCRLADGIQKTRWGRRDVLVIKWVRKTDRHTSSCKASLAFSWVT